MFSSYQIRKPYLKFQVATEPTCPIWTGSSVVEQMPAKSMVVSSSLTRSVGFPTAWPLCRQRRKLNTYFQNKEKLLLDIFFSSGFWHGQRNQSYLLLPISFLFLQFWNYRLLSCLTVIELIWENFRFFLIRLKGWTRKTIIINTITTGHSKNCHGKVNLLWKHCSFLRKSIVVETLQASTCHTGWFYTTIYWWRVGGWKWTVYSFSV